MTILFYIIAGLGLYLLGVGTGPIARVVIADATTKVKANADVAIAAAKADLAAAETKAAADLAAAKADAATALAALQARATAAETDLASLKRLFVPATPAPVVEPTPAAAFTAPVATT